jgi:diguanylate cyclase (GGDEF)-like protein
VRDEGNTVRNAITGVGDPPILRSDQEGLPVARTESGSGLAPLVYGGTARSPVTGDGPVFLRVSGEDDNPIVAPFGGALHADDTAAVTNLIVTATEQPSEAVLVRWLMPSGELRYLELVVLLARDNTVAVHGWEVSAHVRQQQMLEHLALHDALTGLANRLLFEERVREELRRRSRSNRDIAVVYADLDGFKEINDTWGHAAGDIVLTTLADRLRECVRPGDVVARLGGDEFAICCVDLAGVDDALAVAHRLIDEATAPVTIGSTLVRVSVAVGVALAEEDEPADGAKLIVRADLAMYAAKSSGRARVVLAPSADPGVQEGREVC